MQLTQIKVISLNYPKEIRKKKVSLSNLSHYKIEPETPHSKFRVFGIPLTIQISFIYISIKQSYKPFPIFPEYAQRFNQNFTTQTNFKMLPFGNFQNSCIVFSGIVVVIVAVVVCCRYTHSSRCNS